MLESFTSQNLRRLFRVFDRDNDQRLTHKEFQEGLEECELGGLGSNEPRGPVVLHSHAASLWHTVGIMEAKNPLAVSKYLQKIDVDRTGVGTQGLPLLPLGRRLQR